MVPRRNGRRQRFIRALLAARARRAGRCRSSAAPGAIPAESREHRRRTSPTRSGLPLVVASPQSIAVDFPLRRARIGRGGSGMNERRHQREHASQNRAVFRIVSARNCGQRHHRNEADSQANWTHHGMPSLP
jgi:hypothetical protein